MTQATLIPNVEVVDEYGVTFSQAMIVILKVELNDSWGMEAEGLDSEYEESNTVGGGTYKAMYYCSPQARALGVPLKPFAFRAAIVNKCGQDLADSSSHFLKMYPHNYEGQ